MKNIYFPDEDILENDLFFICYMIEKVARSLRQHNCYVVNTIGEQEMYHLLSCANVLHCENSDKVAYDWKHDYSLQQGKFDITDVDPELVTRIPTELEMGAVYQRLIADTLTLKENYVDGIFKIYNDPICDVIDNYNGSAYYEPSYIIARAYQNGGF